MTFTCIGKGIKWVYYNDDCEMPCIVQFLFSKILSDKTMKSPMDIDEKIQALKKNVANQYQGNGVHHGDGNTNDHNAPPNVLEENGAPTSPSDTTGCSGDPRIAQQVAKDMKHSLSMVGSQMVASVGVSYALAWGVGHLFTLSSFSRIIIGALLAFAVNGLTVYRMIKQ